jgi:hypothetical protein
MNSLMEFMQCSANIQDGLLDILQRMGELTNMNTSCFLFLNIRVVLDVYGFTDVILKALLALPCIT